MISDARGTTTVGWSEELEIEAIGIASVALRVRGRLALGRRRLLVNSSISVARSSGCCDKFREDRLICGFCDGVEGILKTL